MYIPEFWCGFTLGGVAGILSVFLIAGLVSLKSKKR